MICHIVNRNVWLILDVRLLFDVVLRPLNVTARVILAMKPRQENFKKPMFDIKVDLDEISLNINRNQVKSSCSNEFSTQRCCLVLRCIGFIGISRLSDYSIEIH